MATTVKDPIRWKYDFISMKSWMNVQYGHEGINNIFPSNIAQKQIKPSVSNPSKLRVNMDQICHSYGQNI